MTARLSFSVAQVRRFIRAAKEEGCRVVIRPDRIEVVDSAEMPIETVRPHEEARGDASWADR